MHTVIHLIVNYISGFNLLTFSTTNVDFNLESISIQIFQIIIQLSIMAINKYE